MVDRLRRVPAWAWLAVIVGVSILLPRLARPPDGGAVHHDRRAHLLRARAQPRGGRRDPGSGRGVRRSSASLYPLLLTPGVPALRLAAERLRGREDDERGRHVARRDPRLPARPADARRALSLLARGARRRGPVDGLHRHGDDGERLLSAFLLAAWALLVTLDEPTLRRQLVVLAASASSPLRGRASRSSWGLLTAPLLLGSSPAGRCVRRLPVLRYVVAGGAVLVLGAQLARGGSI